MPQTTSRRVWVPFGQSAKEVPEGLVADVFTGVDVDAPGGIPDSIDEVEFFVLPYLFINAHPELMARMPRLKVAQTLTAGYENVAPYVPEGVTLCNARGLHDASTAELAVTLTLSALRGIPRYVRQAEHGDWSPTYLDGDGVVDEALADKTVLILGYGSIGSAIERRLAGFEVEVLRVARTAREGVHALTDIDTLLPQADVVITVVPATDETRGMIDAAFLARMKDGALLVNVARGVVVRTDALMAECASGRLRAAMDVTDPEPLPQDHPLWRTPNVLITPHVGGASSAFLPRALRVIEEQLGRWAAGEELTNVVRLG
ncbi:2-hydroxyacid dehydrogenase [Catenulispora sp. NL8]|uniref:2-hydroxyacid dehydrogenase n=1 Tax=Catenulispora pinistramenti TaxID=2705254 RepID=A0ABS5L6K4_9ACTN|nr:2-hydroxyacid dehydrogenase [Catenulispora pinistramenti]MBS2553877.1 2-hydroxyacid dehydrogenase [Catenulispora pinistramenti]